ncbi:MAG: hypothetical protein LBE84_11315 [Planctomycetota bacterium]|jgi:hypothetical protein|nr:hypothetical protein [Planctomycetota bacterium]
MGWLGSRRDSILIAAFDGKSWRGKAFKYRGGTWEAAGKAVETASRNNRKIPRQVLESAVSLEAKRLRLLMTSDLHSVTMELPEDADREELHTALAYEAAGEVGIDAHILRVAAVHAARYRMGGEANVMMTAGFESTLLEGFVRECDQAGLEFDGIGSLEMTVLARHARMGEDARLLFMRRQSSLYVVPACENAPFTFYPLPIGTDADASEAAAERNERAAKRLAAHRDLPLRVVTCGRLEPARLEAVRLMTGDGAEFLVLQEFEDEIMRHAAHAEIGDTEAGCAFVGPPPAPRDPHRAGTWLALFIILLAGLYVGDRHYAFRRDLERQEAREAEWKKLVSERDKARNRLQAVNSRLDAVREKDELLDGATPLPGTLGPILAALTSGTPPFVRITEIVQVGADQFDVHGVTRLSEGLVQLGDAFRRHGLIGDFNNTALATGEQEFVFHIGIDSDQNENAVAARAAARSGARKRGHPE